VIPNASGGFGEPRQSGAEPAAIVCPNRERLRSAGGDAISRAAILV